MIVTRLKVWTAAGLMLGASTAMSACTQTADTATTAASTAASAAPAAGEGGEGGSEAGTAHAADTFAGLSDQGRRAMRVALVRGILETARTMAAADTARAQALVRQGLADTYDADPSSYAAAGVAPALVQAVRGGEASALAPQIDRLPPLPANADGVEMVTRLLNTGAGRYQLARLDETPDPAQLGSAASAFRAAAVIAQDRAARSPAWSETAARTAALAQSLLAPEPPATTQVQAEVSRIELMSSSLPAS